MMDYNQIYKNIHRLSTNSVYGIPINGHVNCMCTQKEKGDNNMNNIKWTVLRNADVEWSCDGDTHIDLEIRGYCDRHTLTGLSEADLYNYILGKLNGPTKHEPSKYFKIKKVHFNPPATVVLWEDGTKTVVKAQEGDDYDPEKGLAMAISKKALGNKGNFNEVFKKWLPEETSDDLGQYVEDIMNNFGPFANVPKVELWKKEDDSDGN